jgi:hypothetical protein
VKAPNESGGLSTSKPRIPSESSTPRGAWLAWPTAAAVCELDLRRPSLWRVFLAVLLTSARYGGREARLSTADLARMTKLAPRTVKGAVAELVNRQHLIRPTRYQRYLVNIPGMYSPPGSGYKPSRPRRGSATRRGADDPAPRRCTNACTSPTSIYVSSGKREKCAGTFSSSQSRLISEVIAEATELFGGEAAQLRMPEELARSIGLSPPISYAGAQIVIERSGNRVMARDYTKAVLLLRRDERVVGRDLPTIATSEVEDDGIAHQSRPGMSHFDGPTLPPATSNEDESDGCSVAGTQESKAPPQIDGAGL